VWRLHRCWPLPKGYGTCGGCSYSGDYTAERSSRT
jgi:hypothetical protein